MSAYHGDDALCAICNKPIKLSDCGKKVEDVVDTGDGAPAIVFLAVCKECEAKDLEQP